MNWFIDVFAEDWNDDTNRALSTIRNLQDADRTGPVEDDCETTAPFIGICPDDTDHEEPSPLDFGGERRYGDPPRTWKELYPR